MPTDACGDRVYAPFELEYLRLQRKYDAMLRQIAKEDKDLAVFGYFLYDIKAMLKRIKEVGC